MRNWESEYRYAMSCIRMPSLGDSGARGRRQGDINLLGPVGAPVSHWKQGPAWLKIDAESVLLSGSGPAPGKVAIVVTATIAKEVRSLDAQMRAGIGEICSRGAVQRGGARPRISDRCRALSDSQEGNPRTCEAAISAFSCAIHHPRGFRSPLSRRAVGVVSLTLRKDVISKVTRAGLEGFGGRCPHSFQSITPLNGRRF